MHLFVSERQDDWNDLIPLAEFQYNNHIHASTQHSPFELDTGRHPRMGFKPREPHSKVESVNEFKDHMASSLEEAKAALTKAKEDMAKYYDCHQTPAPEYQVGDRVYLDASNIWTTHPSWKLSHHLLGPFTVESWVSHSSYRL